MDALEISGTEAQLALWSREISRREARLLTPGREPGFGAVLHVDELRILLVTVQARLEALRSDRTGRQDPLAAGFNQAWQDLTAAIGRRMPSP